MQHGLTSYAKQLCMACGVAAKAIMIDVEKEGGDPIEYAASRPDSFGSRGSDCLPRATLDPEPVGHVGELSHANCGGVIDYDETTGWTCGMCRASSIQGWLDKNLTPMPPAPLEIEGRANEHSPSE